MHYDFLYLGKYLEEPQNISALKQNWTCVFETRMPPAATKSKYGKNLEVLHFNQPRPQGHVMSVKCEEPIDELTVQVSLPYHQAKKIVSLLSPDRP